MISSSEKNLFIAFIRFSDHPSCVFYPEFPDIFPYWNSVFYYYQHGNICCNFDYYDINTGYIESPYPTQTKNSNWSTWRSWIWLTSKCQVFARNTTILPKFADSLRHDLLRLLNKKKIVSITYKLRAIKLNFFFSESHKFLSHIAWEFFHFNLCPRKFNFIIVTIIISSKKKQESSTRRVRKIILEFNL